MLCHTQKKERSKRNWMSRSDKNRRPGNPKWSPGRPLYEHQSISAGSITGPLCLRPCAGSELTDSAHLSPLVRQRIQVPAHHTPLLQLGTAAVLLEKRYKSSLHSPLLANISSLPILSIAAEILSLKSFLYRQTSSIGVCRFLRLQRLETRKHWIIADAGCKIVSHVIK